MVESEFSLQKIDILRPPIFFFGGGTDFHGVPPLTNNTRKTSAGEGLVKIRPAIAQQSCQKKKQNKIF